VKTETLVFGFLTAFFAVVAVIYYLLSHEVTGTVALTLATFLALIVTSYITITGRRLPPRPEDRLDGEVEDGVGEIGFFSPHSIWPLWLAIAFALVMVGVAVGWWLVIIAMVFVVMALIGFTFEYYREVPESPDSTQVGH
jgi:membrane protein implicated in regulation of membrane protease activity